MTGPRPRRSDLRLLPIAVGVWCGAWWGTGEQWSTPSLLVTLTALGSVVWLIRAQTPGRWPGWHLGAVVAMAALAMACGLLRLWALDHSPLGGPAGERSYAELVVVVTSDPVRYAAAGTRPEFAVIRAETRQVMVRGSAITARLPVRLTATGDPAAALAGLPVGQRAGVSGLLQPREPGDPVAASVRLVGAPLLLEPPGTLDRATNRFRAAVRDAVRWAPDDQARLVPSLVVGDTSGVGSTLQGAFRATSLTHLMAVSGANLALTLAWLMGIARWSGMRGRALDVVAVTGVAGFVIVCRGEPSVLRAAAMGLVTLAASGRHASPGRGIRHLAAASIFVLLVDPWLARSVGFALSVAATAGIIWWASEWPRRLASRTPGWVTPVVFVPLAAQLATQPLVTAISGGVSTVGVLANALAAPFVAPVTVLGLTAAMLQLISPPVGAVVGWLAGACIQPVIWIATLLATTPGAVWPWPASPVTLGLLAAACVLIGALVPRIAARPVVAVVVLAAVALTPWIRPRPMGWPGSWDVVFCDVGQGDATVVRSSPGSAVLIDTGPDDDRAARCLRDLGITTVPLLILTHFHADHSGGLGAVLGAVDVGVIWVNPVAAPESDARRVAELSAAEGTPVEVVPVGAGATVGDARIEVLFGGTSTGSPEAGEGESSAENDTSLVLRVGAGRLSVIVAGDAEPEEQQQLLDRRVDVGATVWKMPHHGSARQTAALWRESGAGVAVVSAGVDNDYGHPAPSALRLASQLGMTVVRTDRQGAIAMQGLAQEVGIRTQRAASP